MATKKKSRTKKVKANKSNGKPSKKIKTSKKANLKKKASKAAGKKPAAKKAKVTPKKDTPWNNRVIPRPKAKQTAEQAKPLPSLNQEDKTADEIVRRLRDALSPSQLTIQNLSAAHKNHKEAKSHGGGHYRVEVV